MAASSPTSKDAQILLDRIAEDDGQRVVFLFGAALTMRPGPGRPGVPDVREMTARIRAALGSGFDEFDKAYAKALETGDGSDFGDAYREGFTALFKRRGQNGVNSFIREAVLEAHKPLDEERRAKVLARHPDQHRDECDALLKYLDGWHPLRPSVEALGQLLAAKDHRFGLVLTTNFDPLIEVATRRSGGIVRATVLAGDGGTDQHRGQGAHVVYLHGNWAASDTLHKDVQLRKPRPVLEATLRRTIERSLLVVMGYGGWDDVLMRSLQQLATDPNAYPDIAWACYGDVDEGLRKRLVDSEEHVQFYTHVDLHELLPRLRDRILGPPSGPGGTTPSEEPVGQEPGAPSTVAEGIASSSAAPADDPPGPRPDPEPSVPTMATVDEPHDPEPAASPFAGVQRRLVQWIRQRPLLSMSVGQSLASACGVLATFVLANLPANAARSFVGPQSGLDPEYVDGYLADHATQSDFWLEVMGAHANLPVALTLAAVVALASALGRQLRTKVGQRKHVDPRVALVLVALACGLIIGTLPRLSAPAVLVDVASSPLGSEAFGPGAADFLGAGEVARELYLRLRGVDPTVALSSDNQCQLSDESLVVVRDSFDWLAHLALLSAVVVLFSVSFLVASWLTSTTVSVWLRASLLLTVVLLFLHAVQWYYLVDAYGRLSVGIGLLRNDEHFRERASTASAASFPFCRYRIASLDGDFVDSIEDLVVENLLPKPGEALRFKASLRVAAPRAIVSETKVIESGPPLLVGSTVTCGELDGMVKCSVTTLDDVVPPYGRSGARLEGVTPQALLDAIESAQMGLATGDCITRIAVGDGAHAVGKNARCCELRVGGPTCPGMESSR